MKNLLVMRHAKSDWDNELRDIERPLNKRGKKAAHIMGRELLKRDKTPELILSSPAERAQNTAKIIKETLGLKNGLITVKDFYFGFNEAILEAIKAVDNIHPIIMIVGHNPVWEDFVMDLSKANKYVSMPTAAIASLVFDVDDWVSIKPGAGDLEWLITPKTISLP